MKKVKYLSGTVVAIILTIGLSIPSFAAEIESEYTDEDAFQIEYNLESESEMDDAADEENKEILSDVDADDQNDNGNIENIAEEANFEYAPQAQSDPVKDFVERLYTQILGRAADPLGLQSWTDVLKSGKEQGAKVAQGFIDSAEFKARPLSNEEYLKILYRTFFDREPDGAGLEAWLGVLDSGLSRLHVFKGFAESQEFTEICEKYGIIRGNAQLTAPCDQNEGVTKFIVRNYRLCLGRNADEDGLNGWCNAILTGQNTAKQAAHGFVFSDEFKKKNLSDTEYVKTLYRVFMDREADGAGLEAWVKVLRNGQSREHVFNGFADSDEFKKICISYGLKVENDKLSQNTNTQPSQGSGTHSPNYTYIYDDGRKENYYIDYATGDITNTDTGETDNMYNNPFFGEYQGK